MSFIKGVSDVLGVATAATVAYIAQDVVKDDCKEEGTDTRTEILARVVTTAVTFAVVGALAKVVNDYLFGTK